MQTQTAHNEKKIKIKKNIDGFSRGSGLAL